jgi:hypothetical protein
MMSRRLLAFVLALLLGLAQHAALAHAISHHLSHPANGAKTLATASVGHEHERPAQAGACDLDVVYAEVLGAAGTASAPALAASVPVSDGATAGFLSRQPANLLAAAPRGPPAVSL